MMNTPFGPWCTGINAQSSPHLSTFWKRRMAMLPDLAAHPGPPTRRQALLAGLAGLGLACWPTLRPGHAVEAGANNDSPDDAKGLLYLAATFEQLPPEVVGGQEVMDGRGRGGIIAVDPDSGEWDFVYPRRLYDFAISPDGTKLASGDFETQQRVLRQTNVTIAELDRPDEPPRTVCEFGDQVVWSGDSSELIVARLTTDPLPREAPKRWEHWRMDADGTNRDTLTVPESHFVVDWSPDGRWLATHSRSVEPPDARGLDLSIMRPDGTGLRRMPTEGANGSTRFSPDSRRLAFVEQLESIVTVDIEGGNRRSFQPSDDSIYSNLAWSPDGRHLACITQDWIRDAERSEQFTAPRLLIMDAEDGTARPLPIPDASFLGGRLHWLPKS